MGADRRLTDLSRIVSHALRHEPWIYELELDEQGWVDVDDLLAAVRERDAGWRDVTRADLAAMVASAAKQRHEIDGDRVRALYGHSVPGRIEMTPAAPPDVLYHGTSPDTAGVIAVEGLRPMRRQHVHLSTDTATATEVGRRKSPTPVLLRVRAREAYHQGVRFWWGNDRVWLAGDVPPAFVDHDPPE